jgi:hypothetical protein
MQNVSKRLLPKLIRCLHFQLPFLALGRLVSPIPLQPVVRNNGMVARQLPLGPARLSCIYMVCAPYLTSWSVQNSYGTHITAIPLQFHPFIQSFRCRLSSYSASVTTATGIGVPHFSAVSEQQYNLYSHLSHRALFHILVFILPQVDGAP